MNPDDYVSYPVALALKKAGFDEPCDHYYCAFDNEADVRFWSCSPMSQNGRVNPKDKVIADAPSLYVAQKWLRNVHRFDMNIDLDDDTDEPYTTEIYKNKECVVGFWKLGFFATYESALSAGIAAALEFLDNEKE